MAIQVTCTDDLNPSQQATRAVRIGVDDQLCDLDVSDDSFEVLRAEFEELVPQGRRIRVSFDGTQYEFHASEEEYAKIQARFAELAELGRPATARMAVRQPSEWLTMTPAFKAAGAKAAVSTDAAAPSENAKTVVAARKVAVVDQTALDLSEQPKPVKVRPASKPPACSLKSKDLDRDTRQRIRDWATETGWAKRHDYDVGGRGRIPQPLIDSYFAAQARSN